MKKTIAIALFLMLVAPNAFAEGNAAGKEAGCAISCFFKKLNPMPFLKEQEKKYNERKAAAGK